MDELSVGVMAEQTISKKSEQGVGKKNRRVSEAEPNTQSEEAFMIDRLGAFLIFIAAFLLVFAQLERQEYFEGEMKVLGRLQVWVQVVMGIGTNKN
jgi:hypothetical protein